MAKTEHYYVEFEEESFYHVYNRAVDQGKLFYEDDNFAFFLKWLDAYLSDFVDLYAYCLLTNHFHLLIKVLPERDVRANLVRFETANATKILAQKERQAVERTLHDIVSHQFKKFFQSYAMALNKQQHRVGTLLQTPFKRAKIEDETYLTTIIKYIHTNPRKHDVQADFRKYPWSSYQRMLLERPTKLRKDEVLDWFGGKVPFVEAHAGDLKLPSGWELEE